MRHSLPVRGKRMKPKRPVKVSGERGTIVKIRVNVPEHRRLLAKAAAAGYDELAPWARDVLTS